MQPILYRAIVRVKGTEEWNPMTWGGQQFFAPPESLNELLEPFRQMFHLNEYMIEAHDLSRP